VVPYKENDANITRKLTFTPEQGGPNHLNGKFLINGKSFDMDVIDYVIPLNNTEIWEIRNQSGISHPFHIHDVQFNILSRNGATPPVNEQGWKDVVLIRPMETIRFITKFEDFADDSVPYMYHCHLLIHEDEGMMGQFKVSSALGVGEAYEAGFDVYPNPSSGSVNVISSLGDSIENVEIISQLGQVLIPDNIEYNGSEVSVDGLPKGMLFIKITVGNQIVVKKILVD